MLIRVSNPPHRDLPIEWRTDTGEFIGQPARGQASVGEPPENQPSYGQPLYGQYSQPIYDQPPGQTPSGWTPDSQPSLSPSPSSPASGAPAPVSAAPVSADEFFEIKPADHHERRAAVNLRRGILALAVIGLLATWATGGLDKAPGYVADDGIMTVAVSASTCGRSSPPTMPPMRAAVPYSDAVLPWIETK